MVTPMAIDLDVYNFIICVLESMLQLLKGSLIRLWQPCNFDVTKAIVKLKAKISLNIDYEL